MRSLFAVLLLVIGPLAAQTRVNGPMEGFTFDAPTESLRGIIGFLGSASLGPAIVSKLHYASAAPRKSYALAFQDGQCLIVSGLGSDQTTTSILPGICSAPEGVAWSGDGSLAVLYSRTGNWVQIISGLPSSPNAGSLLDVSPAGGTICAVTADLHGTHIAIGVEGDNGGVFQIAEDQTFLPLLSVTKPISLSFTDEGEKLYIVDGASNQVSELSFPNLTSQTWQVTELEHPSAGRIARDSAQRLVLYLVGDHLLLVYDPASHEAIASVPLAFEPAEIGLLGRDSYLLRSRSSSDDPLWSFRNSPQPMVYFVPATPLTAGEDSTR